MTLVQGDAATRRASDRPSADAARAGAPHPSTASILEPYPERGYGPVRDLNRELLSPSEQLASINALVADESRHHGEVGIETHATSRERARRRATR